MSQQTGLSAVVAMNEALLREALRELLSKHGVRVLGTARDSPGAFRAMCSLKPRLLIVGQFLPGLNGADTAIKAIDEGCEARIVILCRKRTRAVHRALRAGVPGCVCVLDPVEIVLQALQAVATGGTFFCPEFSLGPADSPLDCLTRRETQVLQLIAAGKTTKEIATTLRISSKTAEHYRAHLIEKLDQRTVAELTRLAIEEGMLDVMVD